MSVTGTAAESVAVREQRKIGARALGVLRRVEPFPLLFVYAWIVGIFALSSSPLPHLWRPLTLALAVALLVIVPSMLVTRGGRKAQLVAGLAAMAVLAAWPFVAVVVVIAIWRFSVDAIRVRQGRAPMTEAGAQVLRIANGAAFVIAAVATVNVVLVGGLGVTGTPPARDSTVIPTEGLPNIHLILLDGYPRADTLLGTFGYDNGPFIDDLERRGFDVASESRSNYTKTMMTLASMLNMDYTQSVPSLMNPVEDSVGQARQLTKAINTSVGIQFLVDRGYEIISSGAAFGDAALMSVDTYYDAGGITRFEEQIARFTSLATVLDFVAPDLLPSQHRKAVSDTFANLRAVAGDEHQGPYFMLTHVLSPHTPFLFAADGSPKPPAECFPSRCSLWDTELQRTGMTRSEYSAGLVGQVQHLNGLLLDAVDEIQERDPSSVIAVFSDHGIRYDIEDMDEFFRNFMAVYTPADDDLLPNDASPVNLLPFVFNAHLGSDFPIRPYEGWCSGEAPFELVRVATGYEADCIKLYTE
jgi:hypothetical protein